MSTRYSPVRHFNHFRRSFLVRLACVKHAASVRPEPGSNSQVIILCLFLLINVRLRAYMHPDRNRLSVCSDSLFKELAFSSCKSYNASSSLYYCQYFYFKERLINSAFFQIGQRISFDLRQHSFDSVNYDFHCMIKFKIYLLAFSFQSKNSLLQSLRNK